MEWIKIPTDEILLPTRSDWQNYALIKYVALYCQLEREPTEIQLKRILNAKQLKYVQSESEVVSELIRSCIEVVSKKRQRDKLHYEKKCNKINNLNNFQLAERQRSDATDKIRLDKKEEIYKEESTNTGGDEDKTKLPKKFTPPTLKEVIEYSRLKGREDLAESFYQYYTPEWLDRDNKPIKNWKNKFNTWIMHTPRPEPPKKDVKGFTIEELRRIADEEAGLV